MADFIAVIRRAVDGLSDNTPDMRARVYEKARGAVSRQLENMKPRPPEDMLRRQLEKLEDAIRQVEEEHAEALPPVAEPSAPGPEAAIMPVAAALADSGPDQAAVAAQPAEAESWQQAEPEPMALEAPAEQAREPESAWDRAPDEAAPQTFGNPDAEPVSAEPDKTPDALTSFLDTMPESAPAYVPVEQTSWPVDVDSEPETWIDPDSEAVGESSGEPVADAEPAFAGQAPLVTEQNPVAWAEPEATGPAPDAAPIETAEPAATAVEPAIEPAVEPAGTDFPDFPVETAHADVRMPRASFDENRALSEFGDLLDNPAALSPAAPPVLPQQAAALPDPLPVIPAPADPAPLDRAASDRNQAFSWDAPFDDLPDLGAAPAAARPPEPVAEPVVVAAQAPAGLGAPAPIAEQPARDRNPLAELDELIGYSKGKAAARPAASAPAQAPARGRDLPADVTQAVSKLEGKTFRTNPKPGGFKWTTIALAGVIVLVFSGAAAGLWLNYDRVVALVTDPVSTVTDTAPPAEGTEPVVAETPQVDTPASAETVTEAAEPDPASTEVAALAPEVAAPEKFTQRLLTDGTETAGDPETAQIDTALPEGKTIAGQTVASQTDGTDVAAADAATAPAATTDAASQAVGVTQKLFLYEERIGQGTPVAVEGSVTWTAGTETVDNGKVQPTIEARLEAPDRGLTAIATFKRNSDPSLPASHLIEIVFQLPKDFEGGNIESVDRISFKPTEQNLGNALIGVPAKITDDFHMIALNDDKDATTRNLELMRSRPWIDIPITYRNGRKALLTLEKGSTGVAAFEKVLAEWAAIGPTTAN